MSAVNVLDGSQAFLFFIVLYGAVFLPLHHVLWSTAFNLQDAALILCYLLRLADCSTYQERRFYQDLNLFLLAYGIGTAVGYFLYSHGYSAGSAVDLVWTLPMTLFVTLIMATLHRFGRTKSPFAGGSRYPWLKRDRASDDVASWLSTAGAASSESGWS